MELCKKENKSKKSIKPKKKEEKPNWYNKELEEDTASEEEMRKLEEKLKNYRWEHAKNRWKIKTK